MKLLEIQVIEIAIERFFAIQTFFFVFWLFWVLHVSALNNILLPSLAPSFWKKGARREKEEEEEHTHTVLWENTSPPPRKGRKNVHLVLSLAPPHTPKSVNSTKEIAISLKITAPRKRCNNRDRKHIWELLLSGQPKVRNKRDLRDSFRALPTKPPVFTPKFNPFRQKSGTRD